MKITPNEYNEMTKKASPGTKSYKTIPMAFLIGGLICMAGEGLLNLYQYMGMSKDAAGAVTSITLIFVAALLTGLDLYNTIAKYAGAGTLVPITGFSNGVVSPALEFKSEGYVLGLGAKLFVIAGPVIVYGISASIIYGIILYLFKLY
ncbi:stage V sporulation protein AC [uncultured Ruminococcus sp.]|uniref:Stage V sporulation protein AC n=1 Tax=Massiliimalia timonensis TaxID=1987501 RepID=A0A8J6P2A3_9FIRM|nr:stage V sporulation protein AC [Massiliimalia timonensis]MBC8611569.1 stage V sporulation protein AC [Massiliimalia timonensis]MBS7174716.1 stage V sporulation protein AC [Clostridiales bacterium]SCH00328.1 stage V sporulation protein AC [uncultured Clostridium sp.]SCH96170.1 stage V sporulation protein AC [uncultured Ruminococcus sp.]